MAQLSNDQIVSYFTSKGLTKNQASGIAGNITQESSRDPNKANGFLAQWLGDRLKALEAFGASKREPVAGNGNLQLQFIWHELSTSEVGALQALQRTKTPQEAARVFSEQYERPSEPMLRNREHYADEAAKGGGGGSSLLDSIGTGPLGTAIGAIPGVGGPLASLIGAGGEGASSVLKTATSPLTAIEDMAKLFTALTEPETWLRIAEGIGGIVLIYMGLHTLTRTGTNEAIVREAGRQGKQAGTLAGHVKSAAEVAAGAAAAA